MKKINLLLMAVVSLSACVSHTNDEDDTTNSQKMTTVEAESSEYYGQTSKYSCPGDFVVEDENEEGLLMDDEENTLPADISLSDIEGYTAHYTIDEYGNMSGYDSKGNFYHSTTDGFGNTSGFDSEGNFYHSTTDGFGNTSGFDSDGNYYHYYTDDFGNTYGYDSNGNYFSAHTDNFGNTTITTY